MASVKICPVCQHQNSLRALFCANAEKQCRAPISSVVPMDLDSLLSVEVELEAEPAVLDNKSLCSNLDCQQPLIEGHDRCPYCNVATEPIGLTRVERIQTVASGLRLGHDQSFFSITERVLVGRDDSSPLAAHIPASFDNISRRHAELWIQAGEAYVRDLHSTNGTFLNGENLTAGVEQQVQSGDEIRFAADYTVTWEKCDG